MHYTKSHEWIKVEDNIGIVGISDYAQKELGEIVYIELPKVGSSLKAGAETCVLESTKAAADVYAPVSGKVLKVNEDLKTDPQTVNKNAESDGWLYQIELENPKELEKLMTDEQYKKLISS